MEQTDRKPGGRAWILWAVGVVSVSTLVGGTALTIRTLGAVPVPTRPATPDPKPAESQAASADAPPRKLVHGQKKPEAFGLPSYPSAHDFHSMEVGKTDGSVAFPVREGTAADIVAFYRRRLDAKGWQFRRERKVEAELGGKRPLPGRRVEWVHPAKGKELILLALDHPTRRNGTQAVISWSPVKRRTP